MRTLKKINVLFRLGVRQKVMLVLLTVLLTALSVSGWMALKQEEENTLIEINQRGTDISRFVATSLAYNVVGYDYHTIQLLLDEITFSDDIGYAKVVNLKGKTMGESGSTENNSDSKIVIFNQNIELDTEIVGTLTLGLSTEHTIKRLESQKYALIKREAFIILMIALGEFLALSFIIIRPVSLMSNSLTNSVHDSGTFVTKVPIVSGDEFGHLAQEFNKLGLQLSDANKQLQSKVDFADKQLLDTNRHLVKQSHELKTISDQFRKLSITDALTGLNNRRHFEDIMKTEMRMSRRQGEVKSIIVIDIDFFKKVNDRHGHPCGDVVLKSVASTLRDTLRKTDNLWRIGGEEFIALCHRADKDAAIDIAENMRKNIESTDIEYDQKKINVTISLGIATYAMTTTDLNSLQTGVEKSDQLYRHADAAVYQSKASGRNQTIHFDDIDTDYIDKTTLA